MNILDEEIKTVKNVIKTFGEALKIERIKLRG
jgi:hypothetical protein